MIRRRRLLWFRRLLRLTVVVKAVIAVSSTATAAATATTNHSHHRRIHPTDEKVDDVGVMVNHTQHYHDSPTRRRSEYAYNNNNNNTNSHQNCSTLFNAPDRTNFGPNYQSVPPATSILVSKQTLPLREYQILLYYAQISLPLNTSADDYVDISSSSTSTTSTNPFLNSRADVTRITSRYIARILLSDGFCTNFSNTDDMDQIFLDERTIPFAVFGTSGTGPNTICARDGDYDFSTIDLLQLLYVARQHPNAMPTAVYDKIRDTLLTIRGRINTNNTVETICQLSNTNFGWRWILPRRQKRKRPITVAIVETENHILQTQISRYLTNQLLSSSETDPPINTQDDDDDDDDEYNNTANGNTEWLLQHLATLVNNYFYEYNSKPYQLYTVKALTVLHAFAYDPDIILVSELLLDLITTYSAIQMNALRRFVPYRRKPTYNTETLSWKGDAEFYRLSLLVGNYHTFATPNYTLPGHPSLGGLNLVSTVASTYRISDDFVYPLFFRNSSTSNINSNKSNMDESEYYISHQNVVEMYYAAPHVLLSSGGHETKAIVPTISFPNRFCFVRLFSSSSKCLWDGGIVRQITELFYRQLANEDRGWSRPTTVIPSHEKSNDLLDMIRFQGHRSVTLGRICRNLCVGPNFACGLQLLYGNVVQPILDACSVVVGDWRFIDFTTTNCLNYGYYMAVYQRSCDRTCSDTADHYGLLEISTSIMSFEMFQQTVILNNPKPFASSGIHTYVPISGAKAIQFEIDPRYEYESQILAVEMDDSDQHNSALVLDRQYRNYPKVWSSKGSFQSISAVGRWTFDQRDHRRIYDVTDPLHPIRVTTKLPHLVQYPISSNHTTRSQLPLGFSQRPYSFHGRYFDDSTSVLYNDSIQSLQFYWDALSITGFRMKWRNTGFQSTHGYVPTASSASFSISGLFPFGRKVLGYEFEMDEFIVSVGIGTLVWLGQQRVNRIRMVTNKDRTLLVGYGRTEDVVYNTTTINNDNDHNNHIIAFYGRASDDMLHYLGVTTITMVNE